MNGRHHAQSSSAHNRRCHMGLSGFYLLLVGQGITWFGLGVSLYFQWENRAALRELQWLSESGSSPRGLDWLASDKLNKIASGGGGSEPPNSWGQESQLKSGKPVEPIVHSVNHTTVAGTLLFWFLWLGWVLVACAIGWWVFLRQRRPWTLSEPSVGSPTDRQRALAQRQLAEVRLRKHGFAQ